LRQLGVALAAFLWATAECASPVSTTFAVNVSLQSKTASPATGFCSKTIGARGFARVVTVVCSTGMMVDVSSPHYYIRVSRDGALLATVESNTGTETTTSWRVVSLPERDYLEMTVKW
jgi:hypothetical protein